MAATVMQPFILVVTWLASYASCTRGKCHGSARRWREWRLDHFTAEAKDDPLLLTLRRFSCRPREDVVQDRGASRRDGIVGRE
jgi:hypothetical protein